MALLGSKWITVLARPPEQPVYALADLFAILQRHFGGHVHGDLIARYRCVAHERYAGQQRSNIRRTCALIGKRVGTDLAVDQRGGSRVLDTELGIEAVPRLGPADVVEWRK